MLLKDRNTTVLQEMLKEISYLESTTKGLTFDGFIRNEDKKRVVSMTLINIGELVRHLTNDFRKENSHIPFKDVLGLRDIAAHRYKALRFDFIWNLVQNDIPDLKCEIEKLKGE